jgi:hypothetical protein
MRGARRRRCRGGGGVDWRGLGGEDGFGCGGGFGVGILGLGVSMSRERIGCGRVGLGGTGEGDLGGSAFDDRKG